jgi:hypothetical protein
MPKNSTFFTRSGPIEVAANRALRADIRRAMRKFDCVTAAEAADFSYFGRSPGNTRLGQQWRANASMRSAARRAIAALRRAGQVVVCGRRGRAFVYSLRDNGKKLRVLEARHFSALAIERERPDSPVHGD